MFQCCSEIWQHLAKHCNISVSYVTFLYWYSKYTKTAYLDRKCFFLIHSKDRLLQTKKIRQYKAQDTLYSINAYWWSISNPQMCVVLHLVLISEPMTFHPEQYTGLKTPILVKSLPWISNMPFNANRIILKFKNFNFHFC